MTIQDIIDKFWYDKSYQVNMKQKQNLVIGYLRGSKYGTTFRPLGLVGIAFGSVKKNHWYNSYIMNIRIDLIK